MQTNPRIPNTEREVFAMAFMLGYIGSVPYDLAAVFPADEPWGRLPSFIDPSLAYEWKSGYDCGLAFFCDHALNEEDE